MVSCHLQAANFSAIGFKCPVMIKKAFPSSDYINSFSDFLNFFCLSHILISLKCMCNKSLDQLFSLKQIVGFASTTY